MFMLCGYDFFRDGNALNPAVIAPDVYIKTRLTNGVFSHWNVTKDVISPYDSTIPTAWDYLTVMDANFNGNINAGNLETSLKDVSGFKIKRRKIGEFNWITLKYYPIDELESFIFTFEDNLAQSLTEYEYAIVPVVNNVESNYITANINAKFDGVFICDLDTIYRFYSGVSYGAEEKVQKIGVFEPFGRKYPVIVSNALTNYSTGSFTGSILPNDYGETRYLDRVAMIKERKELFDFLTNKKAKILKDWNGNSWLMIVTGNPQVEYRADSGMSIADINASWTEIGDANNQLDLYNSGIIKEAE